MRFVNPSVDGRALPHTSLASPAPLTAFAWLASIALAVLVLLPASLAAQAPASLLGQEPRPAMHGVTPSDTAFTVNFPKTAVGQTASDPCASECFTDPNGATGNCNGSGTISVEKALSAPFSVGNYRVSTSLTACTGTAVTLPVTLAAGQRLIFDFAFAPTAEGTFSNTLNLGGLVWTLNGSTTNSTGCSNTGTELCLQTSRFAVTASWQTADGTTGIANMVPLTTDTGYMWFFSSANVEAVVKVINGCGLNSRYWVFAGGLTNVHVVIHVTDTATGVTNDYVNPQNTAFQPLQDTSAFVCP